MDGSSKGLCYGAKWMLYKDRLVTDCSRYMELKRGKHVEQPYKRSWSKNHGTFKIFKHCLGI